MVPMRRSRRDRLFDDRVETSSDDLSSGPDEGRTSAPANVKILRRGGQYHKGVPASPVASQNGVAEDAQDCVADEEHHRVAVERSQRQARAAAERAERAQRKALLEEDEEDAMADKDILGSGGDPTLDTPYAW